jgi:hypothetical protein
VTWKQVCKLARALPDVVEERWYGTPGLKVKGKGFARLKEDGASVMFRVESVDEQEFLIESRPRIYFITDHYRGHAGILARLSALTTVECRQRLETAWGTQAPAKLIAGRASR